MDFLQDFINSQDSFLFTWILLPFFIFLSRIIDVSLGTVRIMMVSKANKLIAALLGFFEIIIWLIAIGAIMQNINNIACFLAYCIGFAAGNYVGIIIEEKLSIGNVILRIIPKKDTENLISHLRDKNYGLTIMNAQGSKGSVKVIFSIIKRENIQDAVNIINEYNPNAFYTIEDVKAVHEGVFKSGIRKTPFNSFGFKARKGK